MTLVSKRSERAAIAIMRLLAGSEDIDRRTSRLHVFSRIWFVLFATVIPMGLVLAGVVNGEAAAVAGFIAFALGAVYLTWFLAGGLDTIVWKLNCRIAEERKPWWNRKP